MPEDKSRVDIWMQRVAWTAQVILVIVAIFGYVYSVRPVYQKQLLDEQIAERTVKLRDMAARLEGLRLEGEALRKDNARLNQDAEVTYGRLKQNLLAQLPSVASSCTYQQEVKPLSGPKLFSCVQDKVKKDIAAYLRTDDQTRVVGAIDSRKTEIESLPQRLTGDRVAKRKKAGADVIRLRAEAKKNEDDFLEEVRRLRVQRHDTGPVTDIKSLKELNGAEEANAYLKFLQTRNISNAELRFAESNERDAEFDLGIEQMQALEKILSSVSVALQLGR